MRNLPLGLVLLASLPAIAQTSAPPATNLPREEVASERGSSRVAFRQDAAGLHVQLPAAKPCDYAYTLKIGGRK